jgi:hypothetical protein
MNSSARPGGRGAARGAGVLSFMGEH